MPSDASGSTKRRSGSREHAQAHSPAAGDSQQPTQRQGAGASSHKHQRHVAGSSGRPGARNSSVGRNLSKLNLNVTKEDSGAAPASPRHKDGTRPSGSGNTKRSHAAGSHMPRTASASVLRKNHSSGHLTRNVSNKHLSRSHRPDYHRTRSHDDRKSKQRLRSPSPTTTSQQRPQTGRHASVRFDMGDDDDDEAEEMEGVDNQWTEESASQSPETTRDNTRSNTRSNSVSVPGDALEATGTAGQEKEPPDARETERVAPPSIEDASDQDDTGKEESQQDAARQRKSSYHDELPHHPKPPDAEAIAKRLLQRHEHSRTAARPQVTDISVTTTSSGSSPLDPGASSVNLARLHASVLTPSSASTGGHASRSFDASGSTPGSQGGSTPISPSTVLSTSTAATPHTDAAAAASTTAQQQRHNPRRTGPPSAAAADRDSAIRRNRSTPSFMMPPPSPPTAAEGMGGTASGSSTPGGPLRNTSRTQAKLWLQRGLSNIEANSQSNLQAMLGGGVVEGGVPGGVGGGGMPSGVGGVGGQQQMMLLRRGLAGYGSGVWGGGPSGGLPGGVVGVGERIEKELAAVRRYRSPIEESIERLRKVKGSGAGRAMDSRLKLKAGGAGTARSSRANSPGALARSSFNSAEDDANGDGSRARIKEKDWVHLGLDELEEATLEIRRQMWELQSAGIEGGA